MKSIMAMLMLVLATTSSDGAELTPLLDEGALGVLVAGSGFPEKLTADLTSGLTNRILIRVTLEHAGRRAQRAAEIAIRYDLWDENFTILTRLDDITVDNVTRSSVREVREFIDRIRLPRLFDAADIDASDPLALTAELLLNPIDRERMEHIRKWVAANSVRPRLDPAGALAANDTSLANTVFNKIFEQYASGSELAAIWQQRLASRPFTLDGLNHERR
jgi:hypothetical protein